MGNGSGRRLTFLLSTAIACSAALASQCHAMDCEDLAGLTLPDTTIKSAESIPSGDFTTPDKVKHLGLPAFCRVVASVAATPDSDIGVEIWLPKERWNGVFHGNGNGGYGGTFTFGYIGMEAGLRRGYATATTDMGTAPANDLLGDALTGHPQKWKDWGLISTHVMTVFGKQIVGAFYGTPPRRSYFTGCSTGGQQALIEAQYYPADYDGILAGAPVVNRTWGHAALVWDYQAANLRPGHKLSDAKLSLLHDRALAACGGKSNGIKSDPFIADPLACKFDPAALTCKGTDSDTCLTPAEVETAKAFYSGPVSRRTGKDINMGWVPGSELGPPSWRYLETPFINPDEPEFDGLFKWVFGAGWNWRDFDFDRDIPKVDAVLAKALDGAMKADLRKFEARGGKLVMFQGGSDALVTPRQTVAYYEKVARPFGGAQKAQDFARLFMAPGVGHCGGGVGPNRFNSLSPRTAPPADEPGDDVFAAVTDWVENGVAPRRIVATKYVDDDPAKGIAMQRPLCPYPQKAWYRGSGSTGDAGNFICATKKLKQR